MNYSRVARQTQNDSIEDIAAHTRSWLFDAVAYLWKAEPGADVPLFPERLSIHGEKDVITRRCKEAAGRRVLGMG
jgi:hypothetical protein